MDDLQQLSKARPFCTGTLSFNVHGYTLLLARLYCVKMGKTDLENFLLILWREDAIILRQEYCMILE